ncbi:MAG: sulfite exporter TauE/SafE family protein [Brevinema sp.]
MTAIIIIVIAITHFLSALTGFGCTILAMPFMIPLVGIGVAKPVLLVMGTLQPLYVVIKMIRYVRWDILKIILILSGMGVPLGFLLYAYMPQEISLVLLGIVMLIAGSMGIARLQGIEFNHIPNYVLLFLVFIGGILQGAFVSGGPLIVIYASLVLLDKNEFRASLSVLWLILNSVTIIQSIITNQFTPEVNTLILWNLPFLVLAVYLGNILAMKVSKRIFDYILNIVLLIGGVITIVNQII